MLGFQSLWVWRCTKRNFDWRYYIYLKLDQFSLLLSRNQRRPPSLTTFSIFPNSQTNHRDNAFLFGLSILIQNFTFLALRRAHQFKLCFWALPSQEHFKLWTQCCNSLFMTSTNPVTETYRCILMSDRRQAPDPPPIQARVPVLIENAYVTHSELSSICWTSS